ncbi:GNAT family N-acetyltransferase [Saccharopolyspora erythraea]|uniref:N-acetyltransferase domain-containing protein n=1 Tax=Saccharopolyspora erythraea (strain ATCC 11635 / DSM 40517 / JCM 4748 / NBRC 13426 / NCIMB 8594 / NRRL 2338) TaxID=405948 RepID=A4FH32_SACEN|nr:GNAT family N-acetyltransferase [Saccharopolyspora erythraea]QRK87267.1 GNAT family N-acetyltransferase [Saccharopolyspora erythraea]CAM03357.1 hypothetical protein SACE_4086 [Saccharopolyspora erythraea NRRL 2338]
MSHGDSRGLDVAVAVAARARQRPGGVHRAGGVAARPRGTAARAAGGQDCARFLNAFVEVWDRGEHGYWTILLGRRVAGFGGVQPKQWRDRRCWNLYYRVSPEFWGMGIATETARAAIRAGASAQPGWPVLVETGPSNAAAIRVAERAGLTRQPARPDDKYAVLLLEPDA